MINGMPMLAFVDSCFEIFVWLFNTVALPGDILSNQYYQLCFNHTGISSCFAVCIYPVVYRTQSTTTGWVLSLHNSEVEELHHEFVS